MKVFRAIFEKSDAKETFAHFISTRKTTERLKYCNPKDRMIEILHVIHIRSN